MPSNANERIAREVMGWELYVQTGGNALNCDFVAVSRHNHMPLPDFEHSLDACAIAEAEIERRGLRQVYTFQLLNILNYGASEEGFWRIIQATPDQRCEAMLRATEAK